MVVNQVFAKEGSITFAGYVGRWGVLVYGKFGSVKSKEYGVGRAVNYPSFFKKGNVLKQVRLESGLEKSPGKWEVSVMDIPVSEGWIIWLYFVVEGV